MRKALILAGLMPALAILTGCQAANPASRANSAAYGDIASALKAGRDITIELHIGDGVLASADGGGDAMENSPTQTTDTKPEVAVGVGGGSAGTGGATPSSGIVGEALNKLMGIFSGTAAGGTKLTASESAALKDCIDGNCEIPQ